MYARLNLYTSSHVVLKRTFFIQRAYKVERKNAKNLYKHIIFYLSQEANKLKVLNFNLTNVKVQLLKIYRLRHNRHRLSILRNHRLNPYRLRPERLRFHIVRGNNLEAPGLKLYRLRLHR